MRVYARQANFTTMPRFEIVKLRSFTEMNSQGSRVDIPMHTECRRVLLSKRTLGARDFCCAVSDFCQVCIGDPLVFSVGFAARGFGLRPKMCRPLANTESSRRRREKPLVPRVEQTRLGGEICSSEVIMYKGHLDLLYAPLCDHNALFHNFSFQRVKSSA